MKPALEASLPAAAASSCLFSALDGADPCTHSGSNRTAEAHWALRCPTRRHGGVAGVLRRIERQALSMRENTRSLPRARGGYQRLPPPSCERTPGTFSQRTHLGSTSRTARAYSSMRRPRGSSSPLRLPATLNAWHGLPPMMRSHFPRYELQSTPLTSPRLGTAGNLFSNSSQQNGSISANAMGSHPRGPHATLAASMPENRLMYLISRTTPPRS